ncbi:MAG: Si-specific NAD(P)(+) transhydrogenase [Planctomycetota bacterium]|nr:Si-specific NAD(P)(+) transhydrogenase [Planctomycetota bacterium]MDA1161845.1 Si-specific NAD(P)(+) transhydrogenase [Planctomycetota bacterium]
MGEAEESQYDVVVIGTGPGGEGAAMEATKHGRHVAVVERLPQIGGNCTHVGTIPSKSLRSAISRLTEVNSNQHFREAGVSIHLGFRDLRRAASSVIEKQVGMRRSFYDRNNVDVYHGHASFRDNETVVVEMGDGHQKILRARSFVIATGSRPYRPATIDFTHSRVFDSDTILNLDETPRSLTIYGAGVIGCEYASMFRNLGVKLNLVNTRDKLLEFLDDEIIDALSYHMRDTGVRIRHGEVFEKLELLDDCVILHLKSGKQLKSDALLWANGRSGNTDSLALANVGLEADHRGQIAVNANFQTATDHIYAVGDVIGLPALASAAYIQGRFAARHLGNGECADFRMAEIPTGIYTSPEISSLGKTEKELTEARVPYEVGHSMFKNLARAQIVGKPVGMLKLLFHRETLEILGIHCFGTNASEIIHIGQAIMSMPAPHNSLEYFTNTTFNYPTMAEAYRVAALNGFNRL